MDAQPEKRSSTGSENTPQPKQVKLSPSSENKLNVQVSPERKEPEAIVSESFYSCAIKPLKDSKDRVWFENIKEELESQYMQELFQKLDDDVKKHKKVIFPPNKLVFSAFVLTPFNKIRVVILDKSPYYEAGQADGMCFSLLEGSKKLPQASKNIFKALVKEYPRFKIPSHRSLLNWAKKGVFLLNASLTVQEGYPDSHLHLGWQKFTNFVIQKISDELTNVVFLLCGNFAQKKDTLTLIDKDKHRVIKVPHPSLMRHGTFLDCKCFTAVNEALSELKRDPIDWSDV